MNGFSTLNHFQTHSLKQEPKCFQLKACIDEMWDKEIIITVDGNCNKSQASKMFQIFYPNARTINEIEVEQIS